MAIILYDLCGADPSMRFSPYCWRTKLGLAIKRLAYTMVPVGFTDIPKLLGGASKTLPLIDDSGQIVSDSFAIAFHLDEAYPEAPRLFSDESGVAAGRFMENWAFLTAHPVLLRMMVKGIHDVLSEADQAYFRATREARIGASLEVFQSGVEANAEALSRALEPMRRMLATHSWLGGDSPKWVDCIPFGSLMWLNTINGSLPLPQDDPVLSWFERCLALHGTMAGSAAA